jgi:hypothetical protein
MRRTTLREQIIFHILFCQCIVSLNGEGITSGTELYHYSAYIETLLTYGSDAASSHLTNASGIWKMAMCCPVTLQQPMTKTKVLSSDGIAKNRAKRLSYMDGYIAIIVMSRANYFSEFG